MTLNSTNEHRFRCKQKGCAYTHKHFKPHVCPNCAVVGGNYQHFIVKTPVGGHHGLDQVSSALVSMSRDSSVLS
jgi:hypothetical protein